LTVDPRSTFYQPTYRKAVDHIIELYQAEGFLSVRVEPARVQRLPKNKGAVIVAVEEGPRTRLFTAVLLGNRSFGTKELLTRMGLQRDAPFSYLAMENARTRVLEMYQERGLFFTKIEPTVRFSRDRTLAEVTFRIAESFPVQVDEIIVRGANHTSTSIIRDLIEFEPGDLYRPSLARESEDKLINLGIFTSAKVALQEPELPARVKPLVVTVDERDTHALGFSAGISTWQGVRTGVEYGYRNLFGQAINLSFRAQVSYQVFMLADTEAQNRFDENLDTLEKRLQRRIVFETIIPYLSFFPKLRTNIDLMHLRDNERDFGLEEYSASITFSYPLAKRLGLQLGGDIERNNLQLFVDQGQLAESLADERLRKLLLVPPDDSTLLAVRTALNFDERDNPFTPRRGFLLSLGIELCGSPGVVGEIKSGSITTKYVSRFVKTTLGGSGYLPLGQGIVLAGQLRIGNIFHLSSNSKTYPNRAFFLGGVDTVRGYFQDAMMPQDIAEQIRLSEKNPAQEDIDPNTVVRSADAFVLLRGEIRFPIAGDLEGGLFTDLGNLWADPFGKTDASASFNPLDLRPSAGAGIRYNTAVGPLALDYGIILLRRRWLGEPFGTLHFSIGLF